MLGGLLSVAVLAGAMGAVPVRAEENSGRWAEEDGAWYWYENGVKQGTEGRGKEIYDPASDAWYWLDAEFGGRKAVSKDVYQEYTDGTSKWVRYDADGHMVKGWAEDGEKRWYFDPETGAMAKGTVEIDGVSYRFNEGTGILEEGGSPVQNGWVEEDGAWYWYENGVKQGTEGRGKEIYDPASDAWYWLDAEFGGRKAVSKDVYQEYADGTGKWVRYDADGHMVKGWTEDGEKRWYFDLETGAMAKGTVEIDGVSYRFNEGTGVLEEGGSHVQNGWQEADGAWYWYENGVKQGTEGRGKEIYDPASDAWYWLDAEFGGRKAVSKDVYQEYADGTSKWVRYDAEGHMVKGWNDQGGNRYYFDPGTGAMAKGTVNIDGKWWSFDNGTGVCKGEVEVNTRLAWHQTKSVTKDADGQIERWTDYEYNADGQLTCQISYRGQGTDNITSKYEYIYEGGVRIRRIYSSYSTRYDGGKITGTYLYLVRNTEYANGTQASEENVYYNSDGSVNYRLNAVYGQNGRVLTETRVDEKNSKNSYTEYYEYDNSGNLIKQYRMDQDNREAQRYEYTNDANGNRTERVYYRLSTVGGEQKLEQYSRTVYTYDGASNLTEQKEYYWRNGEWILSSRTANSYDENGNETRSEQYYINYANQEEVLRGFTVQEYMVGADGRAYLMKYESQNKSDLADTDFRYSYGYAYERSETGNPQKYIYYTGDSEGKKMMEYYQVYEIIQLPAATEAGQGHRAISYTSYNADNTLRGTYEVEYTSYLRKTVQ